MDGSRPLEALRELEAWGHARGWLGTDPYEGLNATRPRVLKSTRLGRRLLMQAVKRSPLDLRPLLGIRSEHSAVGAAQVVMGYAVDSPMLDESVRRQRLLDALGRLIALRRPEFAEACWSYHFDVESRAFFYPRTMPNTIATAWAGHALLDAHASTGDPALLELAASAGQFFLRRIGQTQAATGAYFGYFVGDRTEIHNANLLACGLLARLTRHGDDPELSAAVEAGVEYALAHQRADGSWVYAEPANMRWTDGFHTGYVLDALWYCAEACDRPDWHDALERGLAYYADRLFLADGTAKYYAESVYPIDTQSIAQGIRTFALTGAHSELARLICERALDTMRRPDGAFRFQRRRLWRNDVPHLRWAQAPMFDALARLCSVR